MKPLLLIILGAICGLIGAYILSSHYCSAFSLVEKSKLFEGREIIARGYIDGLYHALIWITLGFSICALGLTVASVKKIAVVFRIGYAIYGLVLFGIAVALFLHNDQMVDCLSDKTKFMLMNHILIIRMAFAVYLLIIGASLYDLFKSCIKDRVV